MINFVNYWFRICFDLLSILLTGGGEVSLYMAYPHISMELINVLSQPKVSQSQGKEKWYTVNDTWLTSCDTYYKNFHSNGNSRTFKTERQMVQKFPWKVSRKSEHCWVTYYINTNHSTDNFENYVKKINRNNFQNLSSFLKILKNSDSFDT